MHGPSFGLWRLGKGIYWRRHQPQNEPKTIYVWHFGWWEARGYRWARQHWCQTWRMAHMEVNRHNVGRERVLSFWSSVCFLFTTVLTVFSVRSELVSHRNKCPGHWFACDSISPYKDVGQFRIDYVKMVILNEIQPKKFHCRTTSEQIIHIPMLGLHPWLHVDSSHLSNLTTCPKHLRRYPRLNILQFEFSNYIVLGPHFDTQWRRHWFWIFFK